MKKATFAGGCFWCMEPPFSQIPGVIAVLPGYTGGDVSDPSYEQVISGKTGHVEAVQIDFDESLISYERLLAIYWQQIDPTDREGQFADKGDHYKTVIFYHSKKQEELAIQSKKALEESRKFDKPIVTAIKEVGVFYVAETYHQQYYKKNPEQYQRYKIGSGREMFIQTFWKAKTN